jgi:hypothetical protein
MKEAMKLALEAITQYLAESPDPSEEAVERLCDAASAARKALAQPEQRKPLTDEQIMEMVFAECDNMRWPSTAIYIARAIEAAHGIKE